MPNRGFLTPSTFNDLMTNARNSNAPGKTALRVIERHALDLMGVEREESPTPISCAWGLEHEWEAIREYEMATFRTVQHPVEFRTSPTHPFVGGTMDGLIGTDAGIEIKCPYSSLEHLHNLIDGRQLDELYFYQVQGYLWIYDLQWIDFVSYDPRFSVEKRLYIRRVFPDRDVIRALQDRCELAHSMALEVAHEFVHPESGTALQDRSALPDSLRT